MPHSRSAFRSAAGPSSGSYATRRPNRLLVLTAVAVVAVSAVAVHRAAHAVEEPRYQVLRSLSDDVEVRRYDGYTVAEVVVPGPAEEAGRQAFPILAGYIFGKNRGEASFAMTAPVTQQAEPVKLPMTAPVTQSARSDGFLVQFVLPAGVRLADAPAPLDDRVRLREVPAAEYVVIRYSGFWSDDNYARHLDRLEATSREAGLVWQGAPVYSRYNGPYTPWFLRRNEIWLPLETR